ncbi:Uncharacterised protein [Legionella israelensis]|nr:Uncharacterised protein [Legionella israelensis]
MVSNGRLLHIYLAGLWIGLCRSSNEFAGYKMAEKTDTQKIAKLVQETVKYAGRQKA